ncbi:hypothetical protein AAFF_G00029800 [Aldrovandia affinis]|uniref:Uncharacterized protein n=1 Tax=Aldrovandia affinis TaxID=143900 RepID=A0AAD7WGA9_9TELE|nr:hypothetical protein AAFF_G00029800 [Aldrovandia affinis]
MCGYQEVDPNASMEPLSEGEPVDGPLENTELNLTDMFPMEPEGEPEHAPLSGRFGTAQLEDPNLANSLQQVTVIKEKPIEGVSQPNYPHFAIKNQFSIK